MTIPSEIIETLNRPPSHHFIVNDLKMFMVESTSDFLSFLFYFAGFREFLFSR